MLASVRVAGILCLSISSVELPVHSAATGNLQDVCCERKPCENLQIVSKTNLFRNTRWAQKQPSEFAVPVHLFARATANLFFAVLVRTLFVLPSIVTKKKKK